MRKEIDPELYNYNKFPGPVFHQVGDQIRSENLSFELLKNEKEAFDKANQKVMEAKSDKQKALEKKQDSMEDLIDQMAKMIIEQNKNIVGKEIAQNQKHFPYDLRL